MVALIRLKPSDVEPVLSRVRQGLRAAAFGLTLIPAAVMAQDAPIESVAPEESAEKDRYRVELLFFTPRNTPEREYLDGAYAPPAPIGAEMLYGDKPQPRQDRPGQTAPNTTSGDMGDSPEASAEQSLVGDFNHALLPTSALHLAQAGSRLRNSGRYDVKFLVGWEEAFPPGHETSPLMVRVGDSRDGYADIEGIIQIERQRYLHVNAQLYDLDLTAERSSETPTIETDELVLEIAGNDNLELLLLETQTAPLEEDSAVYAPPLISVMRETRRMRSGKLHFLDAPTMGLLVYFHPLD